MLDERLEMYLERMRTMLSQILGHEEQYLTIDEAAHFLKVSRTHFYKKEFQEAVPVIRCGKILRFKKSDLIKFLEAGATYPKNWKK